MQLSKLHAAAPAAALTAAAPATSLAFSVDTTGLKMHTNLRMEIATTDDPPAVMEAAGMIADAAGLVLANAAVTQSAADITSPLLHSISSSHASKA